MRKQNAVALVLLIASLVLFFANPNFSGHDILNPGEVVDKFWSNDGAKYSGAVYAIGYAAGWTALAGLLINAARGKLLRKE